MIEQVARAIFLHCVPLEGGGCCNDPDFDRCVGCTEQVKDTARAAIAAMRNCTPAMLDAGSSAHPAGGYRRETLLNDIIECEWVAMCDAALECSTKLDVK